MQVVSSGQHCRLCLGTTSACRPRPVFAFGVIMPTDDLVPTAADDYKRRGNGTGVWPKYRTLKGVHHSKACHSGAETREVFSVCQAFQHKPDPPPPPPHTPIPPPTTTITTTNTTTTFYVLNKELGRSFWRLILFLPAPAAT